MPNAPPPHLPSPAEPHPPVFEGDVVDAPPDGAYDRPFAPRAPLPAYYQLEVLVDLRGFLAQLVQGRASLGPHMPHFRSAARDTNTPPPAGNSGAGPAPGKPRAAEDTSTEWPTGPLIGRDQIWPHELRRIIEEILMDTDIMDHPSYPGISFARLREVGTRAGIVADRMGRFVPALMVWFYATGLTKQASTKQGVWEVPQPWQYDDKEEIRRILARSTLPTRDDVATARAAGLNSKGDL